MVKISEVKIFPIKNQTGKMKAFAQITFDESFVVKGLRIIDGDKGLFLGFPQQLSKKDDKWYDECFPVTKECRDYITEVVLQQFADHGENGSTHNNNPAPAGSTGNPEAPAPQEESDW